MLLLLLLLHLLLLVLRLARLNQMDDVPPIPTVTSAGDAGPQQTKWIEAAVPQRPPTGGYPIPKVSDFLAVREPVPTEAALADGEVLVKSHFLSADPYIVSMIMTQEGNVGKTVWAGAAGEVVASKSDAFTVGDLVVGPGSSGCQEFFIKPASQLRKFPHAAPLSSSLGVCGMPGVTAFLATRDILGADLTGQTVVVTAASGAVGSAAGQVARLLGASKVIGLAGGDDKCAHCVAKFGFDRMLNYKSATLADDLAALAPFHAFYDNTGGPAAVLIKALLVDGARVAKVGAIGGDAASPEHDARLVTKGFYASNFLAEWPEAIATMAGWVAAGQLKYDETVVRGIGAVPEAFIRQRIGDQLGKMIIDLRLGGEETHGEGADAAAAAAAAAASHAP